MLVARPSKTVTAIFRVQMHCLNGATIAILFPILNTRTVSCFIVGLMMLCLSVQLSVNPQPFTWGPFGPHSGLMAIYFRSPGSSTTPFKVVVRPSNVYEEVCLFFHQGFHNVRRMQV